MDDRSQLVLLFTFSECSTSSSPLSLLNSYFGSACRDRQQFSFLLYRYVLEIVQASSNAYVFLSRVRPSPSQSHFCAEAIGSSANDLQLA